MKIYIASSWKNQHAVEMLTKLLEERKNTVISFVREAVNTEPRGGLQFDLDEWIASKDGERKYFFDLEAATKSDLVIYIGPSGIDAWAEIGAAWASGIQIYGLWAKGEQAGLMRRMVKWFNNYEDLLTALAAKEKHDKDLPKFKDIIGLYGDDEAKKA